MRPLTSLKYTLKCDKLFKCKLMLYCFQSFVDYTNEIHITRRITFFEKLYFRLLYLI